MENELDFDNQTDKLLISNKRILPYLTKRRGLEDKVRFLRRTMNADGEAIHRIAIASFHPERGMIRTFVTDEDAPTALFNYEVPLSECQSLQTLLAQKKSRIVNDMQAFSPNNKWHTHKLIAAGFKSSFTMPLMIDKQLVGFFFVNSRENHALHKELVRKLEIVGSMIALLMYHDLNKVQVLRSTVESMKLISQYRDPETGEHLQRMASFSLLIARSIAEEYQLSDAYIDYLYLYAPLHDIGKLMVPDSILLKPGRLTPSEYAEMKRHTHQGRDLAQQLIEVYQLSDLPYVTMLTNIVCYHHECIDGSGYPEGLQGENIPLEARIVTVADIFDALTSERPYKKAWTNEQALAELRRLSGNKVDGRFVEILAQQLPQVITIQQAFKDGEHSWLN